MLLHSLPMRVGEFLLAHQHVGLDVHVSHIAQQRGQHYLLLRRGVECHLLTDRAQ